MTLPLTLSVDIVTIADECQNSSCCGNTKANNPA